MLNTPQSDENDILERLRHPEREAKYRKISKILFIRNILNSIFIILAIIAMLGIIFSEGINNVYIWYGCGLFAVIIKMVEVVLRMPGLKK